MDKDRDYREHHEDFSLERPEPPGEDDSPPAGMVWCTGCGIAVPEEDQHVDEYGRYCFPCAMEVRIANHMGVEPWSPEYWARQEERGKR